MKFNPSVQNSDYFTAFGEYEFLREEAMRASYKGHKRKSARLLEQASNFLRKAVEIEHAERISTV